MPPTIHPLSEQDSLPVAALRSAGAPEKGKVDGIAGRSVFDEIMERVAIPDGVTFEATTIRGIPGWWAKPMHAQKGAAILHVDGGWFNLGSAKAYRNFVGHIASSAGADAFIPDYRLAPEYPSPEAIEDLEACYRGLVDQGFAKLALTGDSAGGNLALLLLASTPTPVGSVVFSPITDLALTGESFETRADADPYFTKSQAAALIRPYLNATDPKNPLVSPLYADPSDYLQSGFPWETTKFCSTIRAATQSGPSRPA